MREIPSELYPFEGTYLDVGGPRLHYLDEGSGEPVLAVHGNPTWSIFYREMVAALRDHHRVIVPDHVGCGLSDKPDDDNYPYTLSRRVEDLTALVEQLDLDRVTLVVHDWGGAIGLAWAVRHPELVARLVIFNTAAFHKPPGKTLPLPLWLVRNTPIGALLVRGFNAFARGATRVACTRTRMSRPLRDAFCAPYDTWANRIATLRFVQDIPLAPGDPAWDTLEETSQGLGRLADKPVLICWGEKDFVFDNHFLEVWRRIYPEAEYHTYPDAGHYLLEDAGEEIIPTVRRFIERHPMGGSDQ